MPPLDGKRRARLPNSAFAYVDGQGRRRLPIHDEAHVRNALARFGQVAFESEAAREGARKRLLTAAKKYGIVPIGFITGQLRSERRHAETRARATDPANLPTGFITFLLTDIEGSTGLLRRLGERYGDLLAEVRSILRGAVGRAGGVEVDARADEFFAVFERPTGALEAALVVHRELRDRAWPDGVECLLRIGIHSGRPALTKNGYIGLAVHTAARVCSAGHGGQILLSEEARAAIDGAQPAGIGFRSLGAHRLHGLPEAELLFQVEADDLPTDFPPPRTGAPSTTVPMAESIPGA